MFEVAFEFVIETIKALGWIVPIYLLFGIIGDSIMKKG